MDCSVLPTGGSRYYHQVAGTVRSLGVWTIFWDANGVSSYQPRATGATRPDRSAMKFEICDLKKESQSFCVPY
jgi:hypothetical protein